MRYQLKGRVCEIYRFSKRQLFIFERNSRFESSIDQSI